MAPTSTYPADEDAWIQAKLQEWLPMLSCGKPRGRGDSAPEDDKDASNAVNRFMKEFEDKFDYNTKTPKELKTHRLNFKGKFRTFKLTKLHELHKRIYDEYFSTPGPSMSVAMSSDGSSTTSSTVPIVVSTKNDHLTTLFSDLPEPSGRALFITSIRNEVNMEVNEYRKENGIGGRKHAGLLQNRFKERWNALSVEEQKEWDDQATRLKASKPSSIYQNQERLSTELTSVLYHLRGLDAHQVGNAAFLVLYAVRNEDECLQTASIVVSPDDATPFDKYVSDFQSQYVLPWRQYCNAAIHYNRDTAADTTKTDEVHVDVQGNVVFPNLDWASVSLREVQTHLAAFFDAQWASVNKGQIPWDDVIMNQSKYIKMSLPSSVQLKKASDLEFADVFTLASYFSRNPNITLFQAITTSPLPVPLSPSKPLAPSPKKATSAKLSPSKPKSPNRRLASPWNEGSPATGHEEIDWLKRMRPQRDPTPDPTIADLGENPTKPPNEEVVPPIAEEPIIVEEPIVVERPATPLGEGICPPPESPLSPAPQEISDVPPVKPPVKVAAKVKRARGRPKKIAEAGTETSKDKKRKSPDSGHPKEPTTKRIKPNTELPIPPRRSTRREEIAKAKEPSKTVTYTQCKGARGWSSSPPMMSIHCMNNIGNGSNWQAMQAYSIPILDADENFIAVDSVNTKPTVAGLIAGVLVPYNDGTSETYYTDDSWKTLTTTSPTGFEATDLDDSSWMSAAKWMHNGSPTVPCV
ncbi:hypothetical protein ARMSODRAFT_1025124 [Armillaria solidipes]|uniref:Uncharacterized protein n=1 Tax=Armillaria solidipes TaxID=1076256 RepID=A0A2H3BGN4_9AGAR|nr:hypothetical protein ARMSODRAFT_1025124 [Armillaria solidipes]